MPDTVAELLRAYSERDFFLILLLVVIGLLWIWQNRELRDYEQYMDDHPMTRNAFRAWSKKRDLAKNGKRPTSVICPLHKVFRDTCPPGSHDDLPEE